MGRIVTKNQPCETCGSSDAKQIYEDGSGFCFSCRKNYFAPKEGTVQVFQETTTNSFGGYKLAEINEYSSKGFKERQIYRQVSEHYGVKVSYDLDGNIDSHYYPFVSGGNSSGNVTGYKIRKLPKEFSSVGTVKGLFGQHLYNGGKRLVITEGELDAMAVQSAWYKKYKKFYPVVSMRSATGTRDLVECREWLRQFDEVVIWFDNDDAGQKAVEEAAKIIGYDKVKIAKSTEKDASDLWIKDPDKVIFTILDAVEYTPSGIVMGEDIWSLITEYNKVESTPYPNCLEGLNAKDKGMRFGEITLFTSGTGAGKSSLMREIIYHLVENTDDKIGVIALEESPAETGRKLAGLAIDKNPASEDIPEDELRVGFEKVFADERLILLDHVGSAVGTSLVDQLEYMALIGCKYLFLDHLTLAISESVDGLDGLAAQDKMMNDLLRIVKKHNIWLGLISHLRKTNTGKPYEEGEMPSMDSIRGSGSTKQIAMSIIAFSRNSVAEDETTRNTVKLRVLKSRYTGLTGDAGACVYNHSTGRLSYAGDFQAVDESSFSNQAGVMRV
jgi:twinkle protein